MPSTKSIPEKKGPIQGIFKQFPKSGHLVNELIEELLRGSSKLTIAERELIIAYTSGLNNCQLCVIRHSAKAEALGVEKGLVNSLLKDIKTAECGDKLKPILHFVKKLTQTPSKMVQADVDAIYDAGWDEEAFYHVVSICGLSNYINRLVAGYGFESTLVQTRS